MTMTLVSTVTVGAGGAASIEFTSIAGTATDLVITLSAKVASVNSVYMQFNTDTGTNYTYKYLRGSGSAVLSTGGTVEYIFVGNPASATSTFSNSQIYIPNYAGSTAKSASIDHVSENNATQAFQSITAGSWTGTAAITSVKIYTNDSNIFQEYSTASLYTIQKGSGGASVA